MWLSVILKISYNCVMIVTMSRERVNKKVLVFSFCKDRVKKKNVCFELYRDAFGKYGGLMWNGVRKGASFI